MTEKEHAVEVRIVARFHYRDDDAAVSIQALEPWARTELIHSWMQQDGLNALGSDIETTVRVDGEIGGD